MKDVIVFSLLGSLALVLVLVAFYSTRRTRPHWGKTLVQNKRPWATAWFINLDSRPDRAQSATRVLQRLLIVPKRRAAITGKDPRAQELRQRTGQNGGGALGCYASHIQLWKMAALCRTSAWQLIFEDDIRLNDNLNVVQIATMMRMVLNKAPSHIGIIQFGVGYQKPCEWGRFDTTESEKTMLADATEGALTHGAALGTQAYAIRPWFARVLLNVVNKQSIRLPKAVDLLVFHVVKRMSTFSNKNIGLMFTAPWPHSSRTSGLIVQDYDAFGSDIIP